MFSLANCFWYSSCSFWLKSEGRNKPAFNIMRYSQLAAFLTLLLANFGELDPCDATQFQEDCCGEGQLTAGVRLFGHKAGRRDASRLKILSLLHWFNHCAAQRQMILLQGKAKCELQPPYSYWLHQCFGRGSLYRSYDGELQLICVYRSLISLWIHMLCLRY